VSVSISSMVIVIAFVLSPLTRVVGAVAGGWLVSGGWSPGVAPFLVCLVWWPPLRVLFVYLSSRGLSLLVGVSVVRSLPCGVVCVEGTWVATAANCVVVVDVVGVLE
jgi:hypothetical protein